MCLFFPSIMYRFLTDVLIRYPAAFNFYAKSMSTLSSIRREWI